MKKVLTLLTIIMMVSFTFMACAADDDGDAFSAEIHASIMFMEMNNMPYVAEDSTGMIMGYLWQGETWSAARDAGPIADFMFPLSVSGGGDILSTASYDEHVEVSETGNYFLGVFETSGMDYSTAVYTIGFYNADSTNNIDMMMGSAIPVTESGDVELGQMMAMK
tara:strand:+ start:11750 stop:12244 length:495 start_codon:yes stop_codon:yes gene_type:complete